MNISRGATASCSVDYTDHFVTAGVRKIKHSTYLEFGADEIGPEFSEKVPRVAVEISSLHRHEVVRCRVVGALLGAHEEAVSLLHHQ